MLTRSASRAGRGFSLVELLITITIIAVLSGVAIVSVKGLTDTGEKSACKADVATVQTASEAYYAKNGKWADSVDGLVSGGMLRSAPTNSAYSLTYDKTDGAVGANPKCDTL